MPYRQIQAGLFDIKISLNCLCQELEKTNKLLEAVVRKGEQNET
jgi:hypothetical protein